MFIAQKNGNYIKVNKEFSIGYNRTCIEYTVYQKDGFWKHNKTATFSNSMYDNATDYIESNY